MIDRKTTLFSLLLVILVASGSVNAFGADVTKKEKKAQKEAARVIEVDSLVSHKTFEFVPRSATSQGGRNISIDPNYFIQIIQDSVSMYLPFYGKAYAGTSYGGDGAIEANGKVSDYDLEVTKKGNKIISFSARKENELYKVRLTVSESGYGDVSVIPQNRSMMSYYGELNALPKKEDK